MSSWFYGLSTRWKLALITAGTTAVALIIAGALIVVVDAHRYETQKVESLTTEAKIVAANVVGALVFSDAATALEVLKSLASNPEVVAGAAYDAEGVLVASYPGEGNTSAAILQRAPAQQSMIDGQHVTVAVPIIQNDAVIGTVFLAARIQSAGQRLGVQVLMILVTGAAALLAVLPLSMWLHRSITNPIEELAEKNAIIRTTFESVDHGVLVVDRNMRISFLNDRVAEICKIPTRELEVGMDIGAVMRRLTAGDEAKSDDWVRAKLDKVRSLNGVRREFVLADKTTVVEYRQSALPDGGFVRTYTDITEEKAIQKSLQQSKAKAEDADRAKSQFLAAMSHEIRTPMNGVIGLVELLHSTQLTDEQRQMVEIIRQSGTSLLDVINDILDYSKIEAGRMTIESTRFALGEVVETTTTAISGHTKSKTLNVLCKVDPAIDWWVMGDPVRIRQILLNLMGNALKFTEVGSIEIEAILEKETTDKTTVMFEVRDTGIGIPQEKIKGLFERFSQADYSTTRRFGGTGLGLSIARNLVELMGGEIGVRSVVGEGSKFWFRVPFARLPTSERADPFDAYRRDLARLRVLVCDRLTHRAHTAIVTYLRAIDIDVIEATSISQGVDCLYQASEDGRPVELAILRVHLGEDSAALFAHELTRREGFKNIHKLLVLPNMSASASRSATKDAFDKTISSPICRAVLYDAVAEVTGRNVTSTGLKTQARELNFQAPPLSMAAEERCVILVAEDNETNTFVIRTQLKRLGYVAEFAGDGRDAWQMLRASPNKFGMVLTDCHMPFLDGYRLTGMIRDFERDRSHLPVVALTANALEGEADVCRAAGMDDYLSKPVSLPDLDAMVRKWLPRAAALRTVKEQNASAPSAMSETAAPAASLAAPTVTRDQPPIDITALGELLGDSDPEFLRQILAAFIATMEGTPAMLSALAAGDDADALTNEAHSAKGAAASACAEELCELCRKLEHAGRNENWPEIRRLAPLIAGEFDNIRRFINNELSDRSLERIT